MIFETEISFLIKGEADEMRSIVKNVFHCQSKLTRKPIRTREFEYSGTLEQFRNLADKIENSIETCPDDEHDFITAAVEHIRNFVANNEKNLREFFAAHKLGDIFEIPKPRRLADTPTDPEEQKLDFADMKAYADIWMLHSLLEKNDVIIEVNDGKSYQYVKEKPVEEFTLTHNEFFLSKLNPEHIEETGMNITMYITHDSEYILTIGPDFLAVDPDQFISLLEEKSGMTRSDEELDELADTLHENRLLTLAILELIRDGRKTPAAIAEGLKTITKERFHTEFELTPETMKDALDDLKKAKIVREKNGIYGLTGNLPE